MRDVEIDNKPPLPPRCIFDATPEEVFIVATVDGGAAFDILAMGWERDGKRHFRMRYRNETTGKSTVADANESCSEQKWWDTLEEFVAYICSESKRLGCADPTLKYEVKYRRGSEAKRFVQQIWDGPQHGGNVVLIANPPD